MYILIYTNSFHALPSNNNNNYYYYTNDSLPSLLLQAAKSAAEADGLAPPPIQSLTPPPPPPLHSSTPSSSTSNGPLNKVNNNNNNNNSNVEDFISTASMGSVTNAAIAASNRYTLLVDAMKSAEELVSEKRSTRRESGLRKLFKALTHYATGMTSATTIETYLDDVTAAAIQGLRIGDPAEQYAACRVLEALGIVLGGNHDNYFDDMEPHLTMIIMATGRSTMVRAAALHALSIINFICATDDVSTERLMDLCEQVVAKTWRGQEVPLLLRAAALDCWALLATTIHELYISGADDVSTGRGLILLPLIQQCLTESSSMDLKTAAGQALALIHECRLKLGSDHEKFVQGSWEGSAYEVIMAELQQTISDLSTESTHHLSKKVKKEQRATFRDFRATIVDDEGPEETVAFRGGSFTVHTWKELIPLTFVRQSLQGGFQIQLLTNSSLQSIFGADANVLNAMTGMSQLEKRLLLSKTSEVSKNADQQLTKERNKRNNIKNHFLTADAENLYL